MLLKIKYVSDIGSAKLINRLIVISHHTEIPILLGKQPNQFKLRRVGILILIHHNILETFLICVQHLRTALKKFHRLNYDVIKVKGVILFKRFLIFFVNLPIYGLEIIPLGILQKFPDCDQLILCRGNGSKQISFLILLGIQFQPFHHTLHNRFLIIGIINRKAFVQSDSVNMAAQNTNTRRVER